MFRRSRSEPDPIPDPGPKSGPAFGQRRSLWRWGRGWVVWIGLRVLLVMALLVVVFRFLNPPTTLTILTDPNPKTPGRWVAIEAVAPVMARSVVAAEDANFCRHMGFDMAEIRKVIASGSSRGASTLTQQVAKNVYLWQGRGWGRKLFEAVYTPMIELIWSKRRILEVYLNVAEFGPGVFGIEAAAAYHFKTTPDRLTPRQAALLAAVLPSPKTRNAHKPGRATAARAAAIMDGARTIAADGRDGCFR